MKTIITESSAQKEVMLSHLTGQESIAYKCKNSEGVCILAKLVNNKNQFYRNDVITYGFIPLIGGIGEPRFAGTNFFEAITNAAKARQLFVIENNNDLITLLKQQ